MIRADKSTVNSLAREVYGSEAYTSARRTLSTWWKVELHIDSRGPGRSVIDSAMDPDLAVAYGLLAVRLRAATVEFKRCACGRTYDRDGWGALEYVGEQRDDEEALELRNCTCGSTLAVVIGQTEETHANG